MILKHSVPGANCRKCSGADCPGLRVGWGCQYLMTGAWLLISAKDRTWASSLVASGTLPLTGACGLKKQLLLLALHRASSSLPSLIFLMFPLSVQSKVLASVILCNSSAISYYILEFRVWGMGSGLRFLAALKFSAAFGFISSWWLYLFFSWCRNAIVTAIKSPRRSLRSA